MNALAWMKSTGVAVGLTSGGGLELDGLESLDDELYARVLDVARAHKPEIVAELGGLVVPSLPSLEALARFESDPRGVIHWLGQQDHGQPPHLVQRWAAAIRAEARWRLEEGELYGNA